METLNKWENHYFTSKRNKPEMCLPWKLHEFSPGSGAGADFKAFARDVQQCLVKELGKNKMSFTSFTVGHYYLSGCVTNPTNGKSVYFNIGDVRVPGWYNKTLYRLAQSTKDYADYQNHWAVLSELPGAIIRYLKS